MKILSPAEEAAYRSGSFAPCDLILIELPTGNVGFWYGGLTSVTYASQVYYGTGDLMNMDAFETNADGTVNTWELRLSGINPLELAAIEDNNYHLVPLLRQTALISPDGVTLTEVRTVAVDRINYATRHDKPQSQLVITLIGGSSLVKGRGGRKRTHTDQVRLASQFGITDTFLKNVGNAGRKTVYWGNKNPVRVSGTMGTGGSGGGSGGGRSPGRSGARAN